MGQLNIVSNGLLAHWASHGEKLGACNSMERVCWLLNLRNKGIASFDTCNKCFILTATVVRWMSKIGTTDFHQRQLGGNPPQGESLTVENDAPLVAPWLHRHQRKEHRTPTDCKFPPAMPNESTTAILVEEHKSIHHLERSSVQLCTNFHLFRCL